VALATGSPFTGPLNVFQIPHFLVKMYYLLVSYVLKTFKGKFPAFKSPPTAIVVCKYSAFKEAPNSNCNV